ncbi:MAG: HDIG domain-containing metalloprotein [Anaerolineae bacterium]|nr:HDIG domain-containing protein [Chloroflexota bacterium]
MRPTREDAWNLLTEHVHSDSLIKHALAVEAAMRYYAGVFGEDQELWAVTGLIHDVDYEEHPTAEEHPLAGVALLQELGWPEEIVDAVKGHALYLNVPRETLMAKTLFAVDELTGLVTAAALVRPSKSILDLEAKSVTKKWKDKAFARGVNREDIELGMAELGVERAEHITRVIAALRTIAPALDLVGTLA